MNGSTMWREMHDDQEGKFGRLGKSDGKFKRYVESF